MIPAEIQTALASIYSDLATGNEFPERRPLLAHYTSIATLELILKNDEVWFSNPLFMNDLEELRFGMTEGRNRFLASAAIKNALKPEQYAALIRHFEGYLADFESNHVLDVYLLCLSEHDDENKDGLLSMWRAYGADGNGAAIVFDTNQIEAKQDSPLVIAPIHYGSAQARTNWLDKKMTEFAAVLNGLTIDTADIHVASWAIFERIKYFALFSKHEGFKEEREWRVVYMKERDTDKDMHPGFHYAVSNHGIEPKLRFGFSGRYKFVQPDLSLEKIIHRIILGPTSSSPLAARAVLKMLDLLGKGALQGRVTASAIPYRSR